MSVQSTVAEFDQHAGVIDAIKDGLHASTMIQAVREQVPLGELSGKASALRSSEL